MVKYPDFSRQETNILRDIDDTLNKYFFYSKKELLESRPHVRAMIQKEVESYALKVRELLSKLQEAR